MTPLPGAEPRGAAAGRGFAPDFRRLWRARSLSALGGRITRTALPLLALVTLRATPTEVGLLATLEVAPGLIVGLVLAGHIDRAARRPLMMGADLLRALVLLTVPLAAGVGGLSMLQLYAVAASTGAALAVFQIASHGYLPTLVDAARLVDANARLEASESIAEAAGPGLAGVLVQRLTAPVTIALDAVGALGSALWLGRIRTPEPPGVLPRESPGVLADMATGLRACLSHPDIRAVLRAEAVLYFFGGFFLSLYLPFALRTLGLTPAGVGLIIGVGGVGAFAGTWLARPLERWGMSRALGVSLGVGQGANLLIPLAHAAGAWAPVLLVSQQLLGDALLGAYAILAVSLRQRLLASELLGRAHATFQAVTGLMLSAGALLSGPLAEWLGLVPALWMGVGGGLLSVPLLLWGTPFRARRSPPPSGSR